jgi:hypothetical protein
MLNKKLIIAIFVILAITVMGLAFNFVWRSDTHHGLKYILWKKGEYHFELGFYQAMSADPDRDSGIVGKSLEEVSKLFPDIRTKINCTPRQLDLMKRYNLGDDNRWLGESLWMLIIDKNTSKIISIKSIKG